MRGGDRPDIRGALALNKELDLTNRIEDGTPHHLPMTLSALRVVGELHRQGLALCATGGLTTDEGVSVCTSESFSRSLASVWIGNAGMWLGRGMPCVRILQCVGESEVIAEIWA